MTELEKVYEENISLLRRENQLLQELVTAREEKIREQHCQIAELNYRITQHELIYTQPFDFLWWKLKTTLQALMFGGR